MSKLYGVGVGPGDPELMTIKAVNAVRNSVTVCFVGKSEASSVAFNIAKQAIPEIEEKKKVCIDFPMTKDKDILEEAHAKITALIKDLLMDGNVVLLTLGDPGVYATYSYIAERLKKENIQIITIAGITSFSAAAARLSIPLTLADEELHIIPSSYSFEEAFNLEGTLVFMKSGRSYEKLAKYIKENKSDRNVYMVENCGMKDEKIFIGAKNLPESSGYFTLIIVRG
jgi:precorrin-2 C(20)-methyltransferase